MRINISINVLYIMESPELIKTFINIGKYKFQILDNTLSLRGKIYGRNFKIGGNYSDCVNVSVSYDENNQPISAQIPHIMHDPECSIDNPLDHGQGSVIMIKTLFDYIHTQLPSITHIKFEDKSNIECATEDEIKRSSLFKKRGSLVYPIPLYYFSIAFNGKTWYEKNFNARQKDENKHISYHRKVKHLLYSREPKINTSFMQFLTIAMPPIEIVSELEKYYINTETYGDFFQSIPKHERCRLVGVWISTFMEYHLKDVFSNANWVIDMPLYNKGGNRSTRKYYCPKGRIRHYITYKNFGVDVHDI